MEGKLVLYGKTSPILDRTSHLLSAEYTGEPG